jgi:tetratricopeptide (TPR) repeat protein
VPKHHWLVALGACASVLIMGTPVRSQTFLPLIHGINQEQLENQGLMMLEDAIQLSQFQLYEAAIPRARLATQLIPNRYESWYILGTLLVQQEDFEGGVRALSQAKRLDPKESGIYGVLGAAYFQSGDYAAAIPELEKALQLGDESIEILFDLGNAHFKLKQYDKAIATYERSIKLEPDFWPAINNIGLIRFEQGRFDDAIAQWQKAIAIDSTMAEPQLAVAVATYVRGDQAKGIALATDALNLDGRYGEIAFLDENLWGEQLLKATEELFATPALQAVFEDLTRKAFKPEMEP